MPEPSFQGAFSRAWPRPRAGGHQQPEGSCRAGGWAGQGRANCLQHWARGSGAQAQMKDAQGASREDPGHSIKIPARKPCQHPKQQPSQPNIKYAEDTRRSGPRVSRSVVDDSPG